MPATQPGPSRVTANVGGLIGSYTTAVTAGYWDTATSGQSRGAGGMGKTTSELQTPTDYSGIYADWNLDLDEVTGGDAPWHFGTTSQYPVLQVDFDGDDTASWAEFGDQRPTPDAARVDYDADDDGLIEVANLAQLHAIRWDLDGNGFGTDPGYAAAFPNAPPGMGCLTGCTGYELTADLDFDTNGNGVVDVADAYWNDGEGWEPIGSGRPWFTGTFDGNGHTIANLRIVRRTTNDVGLFGRIARLGEVRNLGLVATDVTGDDRTGGLAGQNDGTVRASFTTGTVTSGGHDVGGLAGRSTGTIAASYARVAVAANDHGGGLVGRNFGTITAGYASGSVTGDHRPGGLVGRNEGPITASYSTGAVTGNSRVGGLVGERAGSGAATVSYWDTQTSGQSRSAGGVGKTTSELQSLTAYSGIFANWNVDVDSVTGNDDPWHFGTSSQYPALQVDFDGNSTTTWQEFGDQRPLPGAPGSFSATAGNTRAVLAWEPPPAFTVDQYPISKYQYRQNGGAWTDIANSASGGANAASFAVTTLTNGTAYSFAVRAVNGNGNGAASETVSVTPAVGDYDADNDGLIEVSNLAQLNAIRWDLDGDGTSTDSGYAAAFLDASTGMGCPTSGCTGYELSADLDLDTNGNGLADAGDAYWNDGAGWEPIGTASRRFTTTFEGNGHTIANLFIDRPTTGYVGLFGATSGTSVVRNVGLRGLDVRGRYYVGGLAGYSDGDVTSSYARGTVRGSGDAIGGLVGRNNGQVIVSYASGTVSGNGLVGGLVGRNHRQITASYASGAVSSHATSGENLGGLVGRNYASGRVNASYARGPVAGSRSSIGGLVGSHEDGARVTASYWDTATTGQTRSSGGMGKTTAELQTPTGYSDIYAAWDVDVDGVTGNDDPWHFGTAAQYPVLQVDFDGNGTATWAEFGDQRPAPDPAQVDYDADNDGLIEVGSLAQLHAIRWDLDGNGFATDAGYAAAYPNAPAGMGCLTGCTGYELTADLDFDTNGNGLADAGDAYWNNGVGWEAIGTPSQKFTATFEGNGHILANLFIDRPTQSDLGLFGATGATSVIRRVALHGVNLRGRYEVGGLVGDSDGSVTASYARGSVRGTLDSIGGLVGRNDGTLTASYASVAVMGRSSVGGLAGRNYRHITASYASGAVSSHAANGEHVGSLVGRNFEHGHITASYARGPVSGPGGTVGGLVGRHEDGARVTASYWDTATTGQTRSAGGMGKTTAELQTPTDDSGIYADWDVDVDGVTGNDDPWHFGTAEQYPVLQVDFDGNGTATWAEFGDQRPAPDPAQVDYDADNDGLIEVGTLAQLHAIRWDLDGNGFATDAGYAAAYPNAPAGMGCLTGCTGYELTADLDFDTNGNGLADAGDAYWNNGVGWEAIGTPSQKFTATFEGNGHILANLFIDRPTQSDLGLFGATGATSVIRRVALHGVNLRGRYEVGGLVGDSDGSVTASYARGSVRGTLDSIGGLVGRNDGTLTASYASVAVMGRSSVGGLAGRNYRHITASYASGAVSSHAANGEHVGSLVGRNFEHGHITASYARGPVSGPGGTVGGLVGRHEDGARVTASYWDTATTGQTRSAGGMGKTTAELQTPTDDSGIYADWDVDVDGVTGGDDPWHFGTAEQYPVLQVDFDGNGTATWAEFGDQRPAPDPAQVDYDTDNDGLIEVGSLAQLHAIRWDLDGNGFAIDPGYAAAFPNAPAGMGCRTNCTGYELTANLDFDTNGNGLADAGDAFWNGGAGWEPLGTARTRFAATFNGNGHTIANLFIDRPTESQIGLFGVTDRSSVIRRVGLRGLDVRGRHEVGGLVGNNGGDVTATYARGTVRGNSYAVGGLVGRHHGHIRTSYASGTVAGNHRIGGLVGDGNGQVIASYARAAVSGGADGLSAEHAGGLFGHMYGSARITASFAWGRVTGTHSSVGGLVGSRVEDSGTRLSYWDTATSGRTRSSGGMGKTTAELQTPTDDTGIYADWDVDIDGATGGDDPWHFGTAEQYPVLQVDFDGNGTATWQEFGDQRPAADPAQVDYDTDNDGLIEVANLAQLHAIRWDLDGDGFATDPGYAAAFPNAPSGMGCRTGCTGYELTDDLDFDTNGNGQADVGDAYWNNGAGWEPLGTSHPWFTATFEGNGHTIANLFIARSTSDDVGLFGRIGTGSVIRGLGLLDVDVNGRNDTGGLVGENNPGTIQASYVRGTVTGHGNVGGLVGHNRGNIRASYASGTVAGNHHVGGLAGYSIGQITASYASSEATGAGTGSFHSHGGLVGRNDGQITASYARGRVGTSGSNIGGLVGSRSGSPRVTASYWDTATTEQSASRGGTGQTTSALQTPTDYSGIYADWNVDIDGAAGNDDPWRFGTTNQYPVLEVDVDGDGTASWREMGKQYPNSAPEFAEGATATRTVDENTAAGQDIGDPLTATDFDEGDVVTYALGGTDAASFDLVTTTGQVRTKAALDHESQAEYEVTVTASDNHGNSSSVTVTIEVGDLVDTPTFVGTPYTFSVREDAAVNAAVDTVSATALAGGDLTYAISAATAGDGDAAVDATGVFAIDRTSGAITVAGPLDYETTPSYALTVTVSEAGGASKSAPVTVSVTDVTVDYDADDDRLIEVSTLAQLNAMRWDVDGDGASTEAGYALAFHDAATGMGCPAAGCAGYELTADLDFDTNDSGAADAGDAYWNGGAGWEPIGAFNTTLDGSGHVIANLFIARATTDDVGLFGRTGTSSVIRRIGLRDVDVTGRYYVGGLAGRNRGQVRMSYATGHAVARSSDAGGLVGFNDGRIEASYAVATVNGGEDGGGLAGGNGQYSRITASYARGTVTGTSRVGGLLGANIGRISTSYALGAVTGTRANTTGGLVGANFGSGTSSYWDTTTSGQTRSGVGTGKTTSELQSPTGYTGIYADWNVDVDGAAGNDDPWDFGRANDYPVLTVDFDGDGTATWEEFGDQRPNRAPAFDPGRAADARGGREHRGGPKHRRAGDGDGPRRGRRADLHAGRDGRGQLRRRRGDGAAADQGGAGLRDRD